MFTCHNLHGLKANTLRLRARLRCHLKDMGLCLQHGATDRDKVKSVTCVRIVSIDASVHCLARGPCVGTSTRLKSLEYCHPSFSSSPFFPSLFWYRFRPLHLICLLSYPHSSDRPSHRLLQLTTPLITQSEDAVCGPSPKIGQ